MLQHSKTLNALTVDLEDWYHPEFVRKHVTPGSPGKPQIADSIALILNLFRRHGVRATFFVLGEIAQSNPEIIQSIRDGNHEIACHGMNHLPLRELTPEKFGADLRKFRSLMADLLQEDIGIYGYRAPTFSLDNRTKYALTCLADNGFIYDSSVYPIKNYLYGVRGAPLSIYRPDFQDVSKQDSKGRMLEFPLTVFEVGRLRIPITSFCSRVLPYVVLRSILRRINRARPFVLYFHPWEICPSTPRVRGIGCLNGLLTYAALEGYLRKVERLLEDFAFSSMMEVLHVHGCS